MAFSSLSPDTPNDSQRFKPSQKSPKKLGSGFRKVGKYLKDQAQEQHHSALYLSPPTAEPQHKIWPQHNNRVDYEENQNFVIVNQAGYPVDPFKFKRQHGIPPQAYSTSSPRSSVTSTAASNSVSSPGIFQTMIRHQSASDNILQSYDVLVPERPPGNSHDHGYWLVYIHGGYFRDPKVTSTSFKPTISALESSSSSSSISWNPSSQITGYASLNYRLAPHPAYDQDPSTIPAYTLNTAHWPDQPTDVLAALSHLHTTYPASRNYILIGHSVGATLAFITTTRCKARGITPPKAVVGVCGIYEFPAIHRSNPGYESLTKGAMDGSQFAEASPALIGVQEYKEAWEVDKRTVLLAHSREDELVGWEQVELMQKVFEGHRGFKAEVLEIKGRHDEVWEKGTELARVAEKVLDMLR